MNLQNNPLISDLITIFASRNDDDDAHIIWVDHNGNVFLDPIGKNMTPVGWDEANKNKYKFRFESYVQGKGYVGLKASQDMKWMQQVFNGLLDNWKKGTIGYVDTY